MSWSASSLQVFYLTKGLSVQTWDQRKDLTFGEPEEMGQIWIHSVCMLRACMQSQFQFAFLLSGIDDYYGSVISLLGEVILYYLYNSQVLKTIWLLSFLSSQINATIAVSTGA